MMPQAFHVLPHFFQAQSFLSKMSAKPPGPGFFKGDVFPCGHGCGIKPRPLGEHSTQVNLSVECEVSILQCSEEVPCPVLFGISSPLVRLVFF